MTGFTFSLGLFSPQRSSKMTLDRYLFIEYLLAPLLASVLLPTPTHCFSLSVNSMKSTHPQNLKEKVPKLGTLLRQPSVPVSCNHNGSTGLITRALITQNHAVHPKSSAGGHSYKQSQSPLDDWMGKLSSNPARVRCSMTGMEYALLLLELRFKNCSEPAFQHRGRGFARKAEQICKEKIYKLDSIYFCVTPPPKKY